MKKGFKLVSTFLVSFMIMMSSIMPAFADETDTSTTGDLLDKIQERGEKTWVRKNIKRLKYQMPCSSKY